MKTAVAVTNAIPVLLHHHIKEGGGRGVEDYIIETTCVDYDAYKALPTAVRFEGRLYTKTGWNSDTGLACYKTGRPFAVAVAS